MAEETTRVVPASPRAGLRGDGKISPASPRAGTRGDDKIRPASPGSSISSGKPIPNYLRPSSGSCHDFCKHGIRHEFVNNGKSHSRRKSFTGNGRDILNTKDNGATADTKKTDVVKPKSLANPIIQSPSREAMVQEICAATSECVDDLNEQTSSDARTIVSGDSIPSDGLQTNVSPVEMVRQEISVPSENVTVTKKEKSLDTKDLDLSKKLSTISKVKPSSRHPSPISRGSSVEKSRARGMNAEGRLNLDGRKAIEGRKCSDGRKSSEGKKEPFERTNVDPKIMQKRDLNPTSSESNREGNTNADDTKNIEGSNISPDVNILNLETNDKDGSLGILKNSAKLELKKLVAASKPEILKMKPAPSLYPSALRPPSPIHPLSGMRSRTQVDNQQAEKISTSKLDAKRVVKPRSPVHPLSGMRSRTNVDDQPAEKNTTSKSDAKKVVTMSTSKPPSPVHPLSGMRSRTNIDNQPPEKDSTFKPDEKSVVNTSTSKPPSPVRPSSGMRSRTADDKQLAENRTSKLVAKKVGTSTTKFPSSRSSVNGEGNTSIKMVRYRVVSSVRREGLTPKVKAKDPNKQDVQENTEASVKISSEKKSLASAKVKVIRNSSLLPPVISVSKSTIRSRTSYVPPHLKKPLIESKSKVGAKDASTSGLRKGKAVDLESGNDGLSKPRMRKNSHLMEVSATHINRPSLRKRDVTARDAVKTNNSDVHMLKRPSIGRKKSGQVLFNKVIQDTANRLVRVRKSKVLALVGAFETVISIQKKSSAATKLKSKKKSSSAKPSR